MRIRWLGWAGVEIEEQGERVVVDPLEDAAAVFVWLCERAAATPRPEVIAPRGGALAGDASVYEPQGYGGSRTEQLTIAQADYELRAAGLKRRPTAPWTSITIGPFTLTALPAVDGTGDPQVSWLIEADGKRVLHLGDTMFHGWWWRVTERFGAPNVVLAPINGARVSFPHRRPASPLAAVMDPEQAALAAELLQADQLLPIHYDGYALRGVYEPVPDALNRLKAKSNRITVLELGESVEI
ncbi:MAG: MBL fold metallo-hydrolase [Solirubrobacteraceae bacterium]